MPPFLHTARKRCLASALLVSAWLAACGGGESTPAAPPAAQVPVVAPGNWVVLGSSSAQGIGANTGRGWASLLATTQIGNQVTVLNLAKAGTSTYAGLPTSSLAPPDRPAADTAHNIDRALLQQPRLLLISFPTNDTALGFGADETVKNLQTLRQTAAAAGAATLVLGTQPRDGFDAGQNSTLQAIDQALGQQLGACFVPLRAALSDPQGRIATAYAAGDGIHLNDAGHAQVAQRVQAVLDSGRCVRLRAN